MSKPKFISTTNVNATIIYFLLYLFYLTKKNPQSGNGKVKL